MKRIYSLFLVGILLPIASLPTRTTLMTVWHSPDVQHTVDLWTDRSRVALVALARQTRQVSEMSRSSMTITVNGTPVPVPTARPDAPVQPGASVALDTANDLSLHHGQSVDAASIDAILAEMQSPAAGTGVSWLQAGQRTGIDAAYVLAMFILESRAGTDPAWAGHTPDGGTTHNIGNIICAGYATCFNGYRDYPDWHTGIAASFDLLADYRDTQGKRTIGEAIYTWAPPRENNTAAYVTEVERLVAGWRSIQAAPQTTEPGLIDPTPTHTHPVTDDMRVTATFSLVNCAYWAAQPGCQHYGTDYALRDGQPVYAPVAGTFITSGAYPEGDPLRRTGAYLIYLTDDDHEFYAGHMKNVPAFQPGQRMHAGAVIGYGRGDLAHTHIQVITPDGTLTDFESYYHTRTP